MHVIVTHRTCCRHRSMNWLPKGHLARLVADSADQLERTAVMMRLMINRSPVDEILTRFASFLPEGTAVLRQDLKKNWNRNDGKVFAIWE